MSTVITADTQRINRIESSSAVRIVANKSASAVMSRLLPDQADQPSYTYVPTIDNYAWRGSGVTIWVCHLWQYPRLQIYSHFRAINK